LGDKRSFSPKGGETFKFSDLLSFGQAAGLFIYIPKNDGPDPTGDFWAGDSVLLGASLNDLCHLLSIRSL
jgi:hypothetical protein